MYKLSYHSYVALLICSFVVSGLHAQDVIAKYAPSGVKIDGIATEWQGYEEIQNDKSQLSYLISSDTSNLYLVLKTKDKKKQQNILGAGLTFSLDPKGKKKATFSTTFPSPDGNDLSDFKNLETAGLMERVKNSGMRQIRLHGFDQLPEYIPSQKNNHNIQAAISFNADGELIYEECIPLKLIGFDGVQQTPWAFNIKVNGLYIKTFLERNLITTEVIAVPAGTSVASASRGGRGTPKRVNPAGNADNPVNAEYNTQQLTPSMDFWGKFTFPK
ncbi:DOMON domain-containing protein [Mucilaginibacter auburnensis]|uniref:Outer membrane lipoprotein-sorting protein n=1 Tax=Mucilaginibacter auburnensis TaxID=1457233 RepID=A0A2H9VMJ3_9SPHI|nr:hypothetical protein [Mucilaginibacter auburnensis]PJJ79525.1 hypothetical protein CLV57_2659 [Mucilaginibacter auburnensis]